MTSEKSKFVADIPDLINEWDFDKNPSTLSPWKLTLGSNKKVSWKCAKGHQWEEAIYHRAHGKLCPYCANKRVAIGYNDLRTLYPELALEWDYQQNHDIDINTVVPGSAKIVSWRCSDCGHTWTASIRSRTQRKSGCPKCAIKYRGRIRHEHALKTTGSLCDSDLLDSWDYEKNHDIMPTDITPYSNKKVWWKCPICNYSWQAKVCNRSNGRSCPQCSNRILIKGVNDLATLNPVLAAEWDFQKNSPLTPSDVFSKSGKKYHWICPKGHEYQTSVLHRASGTNCPVCNSGRQTSFAEQAFFYYIKQVYPDAINHYTDIFVNGMELDIFIPSIRLAIEYDGSFWHRSEKSSRDKEKYTICTEKGIYLIRIRESNTPVHDLADEIFFIENISKPENLEQLIRHVIDRIDSHSNMWMRKKAVFHSPLNINLSRDESVIRQYMNSTKNSFEELYPDLALEWHPSKNGSLKPNAFKCGSDYKAWWKCQVCGHEWRTSVYHRVHGTGCPVCYRKQNKLNHPLAKKVYQFSKDGTFITEWNSISEAGRNLSISSSNISMCIKHKRKYAGGYIWRDALN